MWAFNRMPSLIDKESLYDLSIYYTMYIYMWKRERSVGVWKLKFSCYHNCICPKLFCILGILSSKLVLKFEYVITSISLWFVEEVKNIYLFIGIYYTEFLDIAKKFFPIPPS